MWTTVATAMAGLLIGAIGGLYAGLSLGFGEQHARNSDDGRPNARAFRDDVIWAYREILGRSPESDAFIELWASRRLPVEELAQAFMRSAEFKSLSHSEKQRANANLRRRQRTTAPDRGMRTLAAVQRAS